MHSDPLEMKIRVTCISKNPYQLKNKWRAKNQFCVFQTVFSRQYFRLCIPGLTLTCQYIPILSTKSVQASQRKINLLAYELICRGSLYHLLFFILLSPLSLIPYLLVLGTLSISLSAFDTLLLFPSIHQALSHLHPLAAFPLPSLSSTLLTSYHLKCHLTVFSEASWVQAQQD